MAKLFWTIFGLQLPCDSSLQPGYPGLEKSVLIVVNNIDDTRLLSIATH